MEITLKTPFKINEAAYREVFNVAWVLEEVKIIGINATITETGIHISYDVEDTRGIKYEKVREKELLKKKS